MDHWRITKVESGTGSASNDMYEAISYYDYSIPNQTEVLWRDDESRGWHSNKEYHWELEHRPLQGVIKVKMFDDGGLIFDTGIVETSPSANKGKLGVFVTGQPSTYWYNM